MSHGTAPLPALPAAPTLWAETVVDVQDRDLDIPVTLRAGARISGRVEFDGTPAPSVLAALKNVPILVTRADGESADLRGLFQAGGRFTTIQIPPGKHLIHTYAPEGWGLKSIVHQGRQIADEPFDIGATDIDDVVITFTDRPSILAGSVTGEPGARQRPWVIVFPADRKLWTDYGWESRRIATVLAGTAGTYDVRLPQGSYDVIANDEGLGPVRTPEVFEALASSATRIWIGDGEKKIQNLVAKRVRVSR